MKIKLLVLVTLPIYGFGQLKVKSDGNVGIGTSNPYSKLEIVDVDKTTEARVYVASANNARIWTGNSLYAYGMGIDNTGNGHIYRNINTPAAIMSFNSTGNIGVGSLANSTDKLLISGNFKVQGSAYCLYGVWSGSDINLKQNISPIKGALDKILRMNGKTYEFKGISGSHYGLIAQEVKEVIPELVMKSDSLMHINYDGLIPVLIEAIKEQENKIQELKSELEGLKRGTTVINTSLNLLHQNTPNPFTRETRIKYFVESRSSEAYINIYDMQGSQVKSYKLVNKEDSELVISGQELKPGIYLYSLIVDGKEVDCKRMILTD